MSVFVFVCLFTAVTYKITYNTFIVKHKHLTVETGKGYIQNIKRIQKKVSIWLALWSFYQIFSRAYQNIPV